MRILIIVILSLLSANTNKVYHPIHLSIINIDYNEQNSEFKILIRLFTDDFEAILNKELKTNIKITGNDLKKNQEYLQKFITKKFSLIFNNNNIIENIKIFETNQDIEKNTTEIIYKFKHKKPKKVKVKNILFLSHFSDQKNLFIFTCGKTQETYKFTNNKTEFEFKL